MIRNIYKEMLNNLFEGIYYVDTDRTIEFWNKAAEAITGFKAREVLGTNCAHNILSHVDEDGNPLCNKGCPLHATLIDGEFREASVYLHHKNGHRVPVNVKVFPLYDGDSMIGAMEIFVSTENKRSTFLEDMEDRVAEYIDELTGVSNQKYAKSMLNVRHTDFITTNIPYGVVLIDIDNFTDFKTQYGEDFGDRILTNLSKSLFGCIRDDDFMARWDEDEFMIVHKGVNLYSLEKLVNRANMLANSSTVRTDKDNIGVTVSIGAAIVHPTDTVESLIERVDELLQWSKSNGGDRITI